MKLLTVNYGGRKMTTSESNGFIQGAFYQSSNCECTSDVEPFVKPEEQGIEMFTYFKNPKTGRLDFKPKIK